MHILHLLVTQIFVQGVLFVSVGLCLEHLALVFNIETSEFFITYLAQSVGAIVGVIASAFLLQHFPCELLSAIGNIVIAATCIIASLINDIYSFSALRCIAFVCIGHIESGAQMHVLLLLCK